MRLSWNEVRARAAAFAEDWKDAAYEKGETQSFYNAFFDVFGVRRRNVARYEAHVAKLDNRSGFIDLYWPGVLLVEQKSAGRDLRKAYKQAGEYFDALAERERPRFILVSDFQTFELHDLDEREVVAFPLADLPAHIESFGFILGVQRRTFRDQDPANIQAAELVGRLHDALADAGHRGHDLERFLVRLVFCMFADDTGVFEPRDIFLDFIETRTGEDGADLGPWLAQLFEVLDTREGERAATLDEDLARFPYVNGDLFRGHLRTFSFDAAMRGALLDACRFDWSNISPAIFGALFQSVMDSAERRAQGAHYTTEKNILKVIEPLFMDDLRAEFERVRRRRGRGRLAALRQFQAKLGGLTFFDPACGCGNFLIIAYRELRLLEIEVIREIRAATATTTQAVLDTAWQSVVDVDQFYGIELGEFPARIAETALWMMDHIMNNRLSLEFGNTFVRIPLEKSPHIVHGDALETDWSGLLPPGDCSFVLGNPPFVGAKYQTPDQRAQVRRIAALGKSGGTLDYVAAWFIKAGEYVNGADARIGFVATNSITAGEQVAQLWPVLFGRCKLEVAFAHRTFAWGSDARGKAHVHVVILGLDRRKAVRAEKRLFSYPDLNGDPEESGHAALSPYLFDAVGLSDPPSGGAGGKRTNQRDGAADHRFQAHRRRRVHLQHGGTRRISGCGAGSRALAPTVHRRTGILAGRRAVDSGASRHAARRTGAVAACAGTDRRRPCLPRRQQERADAQARGNADSLPCKRRPHRAVPGDSRSQFGAAGVRAYRVAGAAGDSEQQAPSAGKRDSQRLHAADFGHAHGMDAVHRWSAEKRLPVFGGRQLQHLPAAAQGLGPVEAGTARPSGARCAREPLGRDAGRSIRPGPDAAESASSASGGRPRGGSALSPRPVCFRARARRASFRRVRENAGAVGPCSAGQVETAAEDFSFATW